MALAHDNNPATTAEMFESLAHGAHVWYCNPQTIVDPGRLADCRSVLSAKERVQFERFHFKHDQQRYLVSHALLRKALSLYEETRAQDWAFEAGEHGKPRLATASTRVPLQFNLSHTDDLCACVITRERACGIDVEQLARNNSLLAIAERMFAEAELATLRALPEIELRQAFFGFWTLREAYLKALGSGLVGSQKTFHFEIARADSRVDDVAGATSCRSATITFADGLASDDWQFEVFQPGDNHLMSVALHTRGMPGAVRWRFMEP